MLGGRETRHIIANFCQNSRSSKGGNAHAMRNELVEELIVDP